MRDPRVRLLRWAADGLDELGRIALSSADRLRKERDRLREKARAPNGVATPDNAAKLPLAEANRAFADKLIAEAKAKRPLPPGETTFVEDTIALFENGIASPLFQEYVVYALSSIDRGERIRAAHASLAARAKSYLDVGCAYGGAVMAMARAGVRDCAGVEYDARLLKLAEKQANELGLSDRVRFFQGDFTDPATAKRAGSFDLVTCIDVLEHVLDPTAAIGALAACTNPGGAALVDVPNPLAHESVRGDPHHHILANVLLGRDEAIRVFEHEMPGNKTYGVGYYHPLEWYKDRLESVGFEVTVLDRPPADEGALRETQSRLAALGDELVRQRTVKRWPDWRSELVKKALAELETRVSSDRDLATADPLTYQLRYAVPVIHFSCRRRA